MGKDERKFKGVGMGYGQAIKTATRHAKEGSSRLVESMANQVKLKEGSRASNEFRKEAYSKGSEKRKTWI